MVLVVVLVAAVGAVLLLVVMSLTRVACRCGWVITVTVGDVTTTTLNQPSNNLKLTVGSRSL
jgi:hypothetical protein